MSKKFKILCLFILMFCINCIANASRMDVSVYINKYYNNQLGHYIDANIGVDGSTLKWTKNTNGQFQSSVAVSIAFTRNDSVFSFRNYTLKSPAIDDLKIEKPDFFDICRLDIAPGNYSIEIELSDMNDTLNSFGARNKITIPDMSSNMVFSSVLFLSDVKASEPTNSPLYRYGYILSPSNNEFYGEQKNEINLFTELYNSKKILGEKEKFILNFYIENYETNTRIPDYNVVKKMETAEILPVIQMLDITNVPSGNYNMVIEARDKENKLITQSKIFFQRSKNIKIEEVFTNYDPLSYKNTFVDKINTLDSISECLRCIRAISTKLETEFSKNLVENKDIDKMKSFFYTFWFQRDPENTEKAWLKYHQDVLFVNENFKAMNRKGYATDRGRVYLQYGKPDSRDVHENDPGVYPYEIWQYYKLHNRSNRRFVFYNPEIATARWILLHSDAIGERRDDRWQLTLQRINRNKNEFMRNLDTERGSDFFGNRIEENFNTPR